MGEKRSHHSLFSKKKERNEHTKFNVCSFVCNDTKIIPEWIERKKTLNTSTYHIVMVFYVGGNTKMAFSHSLLFSAFNVSRKFLFFTLFLSLSCSFSQFPSFSRSLSLPFSLTPPPFYFNSTVFFGQKISEKCYNIKFLIFMLLKAKQSDREEQ